MSLQSTAEVGNILQNALVFNVNNWLGDAMNTDSLLDSVEEFFTLLDAREIDYVLVGGIALLHYVEGRNTEDLDLIMALSSLEKLPEINILSQDMYFARGEYKELQVDFLFTKNPLFKSVQKKHATTHHFLDRDISFATVEGLLLLKLYALPSLYRQGNFSRVGIYENDIATLLYEYKPNLSLLLKELSSYMGDDDLVEIESILSDIQQRITRFQQDAD